MDLVQSAWLTTSSFLGQIGSFLPRLLLAVIVLLIGWLLAKAIRSASIKLMTMARIGEAAEKAGIESFIAKGGFPFTTITLLGQLVYWFVVFTTFLVALDIFDLKSVEDLLSPIISFIPNVFIAVIILIFGSLIANFVQGVIKTYLGNIGVSAGNMVGTAAYYTIIVLSFFLALNELGIGAGLVSSAFQIILAGLALAFGLAFGLGGKDVAKAICDKIYKSFTKE